MHKKYLVIATKHDATAFAYLFDANRQKEAELMYDSMVKYKDLRNVYLFDAKLLKRLRREE